MIRLKSAGNKQCDYRVFGILLLRRETCFGKTEKRRIPTYFRSTLHLSYAAFSQPYMISVSSVAAGRRSTFDSNDQRKYTALLLDICKHIL